MWMSLSGLALTMTPIVMEMENLVRKSCFSMEMTSLILSFSLDLTSFFHYFLFFYFQVVSHSFSINVMDEHVLKGNSAVLKCHIPSFVSDFVVVDAWIDEETNEHFLPGEHHLGSREF